MSWMDRFFGGGYSRVQISGVDLPGEVALNFVSGATAVDNPGNDSTDVTIGGGGGGGGSVTAVLGSAPIASSGGASPTISISAATSSAAGSMSAADKTKADKYPAVSSLTTGQCLRATGASTVAYGALDLANANATTGTLPASSQAAQTMGGDCSGTTTACNVLKINATTITTPGGALTTGAVLRVTGVATADYGAVDLANTNAVTGTLPTARQAAQAMGGDCSGTTAACTVAKVNGTTYPAGGALTTGQVPRVTGVATVAYGALDLANASAVTGTLPTGNQAAQAMGGDCSGTTAACTVAKVNGTTFPAGGALTTGQVPRVTGVSTVAYGALDLANANAVTGLLPLANVASGFVKADGTVNFTGNEFNSKSFYAGGTAAINSEQDGSLVTISTASGSVRGFVGYQISSDTASCQFVGSKARGAVGALTAVASGDVIMNWLAAAYDGSAWQMPVNIRATCDGTPTSGASVPMKLGFYTGNSTPTLRLEISSAGVIDFQTNQAKNIGDASADTDAPSYGQMKARFRTARVTNVSSSPYTILATDEILNVDTTAVRTLNLPNPANAAVLIIKDKTGSSSTNVITLARNGSEKIEGVASNKILSAGYGAWLVYSDGTDWYLMGPQ